MKPTDPRLRPLLRPAATALALVGGASLLGTALVIAQAFAVSRSLRLGEGLAVVVLVLLARGLVTLVQDVAAARAAGTVSLGLRERLLGSAGARADPLTLTRGVASTEPYLTRYVPAFFLAAVLPVAVLVVIALLDWISALIVVLTLPLIPVFGWLIGVATRERATRQWQALQQLAGHFLDVVRGLPTLVAYRRGEAQVRSIREVSHRYRRLTLDTLRIAFASSAVLELVATISVAVVAVTVGLRLATGHMSLSTALVVLLLAPEAYWPLRRVGQEFHAATEGAAVLASVSGFETPPEGGSSTNGGSVVEEGEARLETTPGLTVIAGPSGSGKTTLVREWVFAQEPGSVAYVAQSPRFVLGSVAENLRLGDRGASEGRLREALERVGLGSVPLDAPLGEDGLTLSAGERARLALARALLSDRPFLVLDEPTAHLDAATEARVVALVAEAARRRAVVVVAHSPAWLEAADEVRTMSPREVVA